MKNEHAENNANTNKGWPCKRLQIQRHKLPFSRISEKPSRSVGRPARQTPTCRIEKHDIARCRPCNIVFALCCRSPFVVALLEIMLTSRPNRLDSVNPTATTLHCGRAVALGPMAAKLGSRPGVALRQSPPV